MLKNKTKNLNWKTCELSWVISPFFFILKSSSSILFFYKLYSTFFRFSFKLVFLLIPVNKLIKGIFILIHPKDKMCLSFVSLTVSHPFCFMFITIFFERTFLFFSSCFSMFNIGYSCFKENITSCYWRFCVEIIFEDNRNATEREL